jgi:hypothetical protein
VIKASALLVALAIGLLVAGVVASSLLMVYVSIGVCAVAALLLAVGVLAHWSEIFGRREAPSAMPGAWSEPQVNVTAPVLASIQAVADGGRAPGRPAGEVPSPAEVAGRDGEFAAPRRSDELWERVEEELGSAAKRDTGALSWPGTVFPPVPPDLPESDDSAAPAPEAGPHGQPRAGDGAWLRGPVPDESAADADVAPDVDVAEDAEAVPDYVAVPDGDVAVAEDVVPADDVAVAEDVVPDGDVALDQDVVPDDDVAVAEDAVPAGDPAPDAGDEAPDAEGDEPADGAAAEPAIAGPPGEPGGEDSPPWIVATSRPAGPEPAADTPPAQPHAAQEETTAEKPATEPPGADGSAAKEPAVKELAAQEPAAEEPAAEEPAAEQPAPGTSEPAAEEPSGDRAAGVKPAPGRVTVVPGVARYHRSECILIRFLGAGDLETMTKQEAVDAKLVACRACQPDELKD